MGSKRAMLKNGLGQLLDREIRSARRFVDLFSGSGVVASFVATQYPVPVWAVDLQEFSAILTRSVIARKGPLDWEDMWRCWLANATIIFDRISPPAERKVTQSIVHQYRVWAARQRKAPVTKAYGGHYFSPCQSAWIDALRRSLPPEEPAYSVGLAALLHAASECAAAPGHTAQPFQPTRTAKQFLEEAWSRDIVERTKKAARTIGEVFALRQGQSTVADANSAARRLKEGDLVFIDPPYSGVHYSRFYHVLETISRGACDDVSGIGRYPPTEQRPKSRYSLRAESCCAIEELFEVVASRRSTAILTFPDHQCSNGLSGDVIRGIARKHFRVREKLVDSTFSTLGGVQKADGTGRLARHSRRELLLLLSPK